MKILFALSSRLWAGLLVFFLIAMLFANLSGCRSVKLNKTSTSYKVESAATHDSAAIHAAHFDSSGSKKIASNDKKTAQSDNKTAFHIDFFGDSSKPPSPFTVKENADGSYTVDPGTNRPKDATLEHEDSKSQTDSSATREKDTSHVSHADSGAGAVHNILHVGAEGKSSAKTKTTSGISTGKTIALVVFLLLLVAAAIWAKNHYAAIKAVEQKADDELKKI